MLQENPKKSPTKKKLDEKVTKEKEKKKKKEKPKPPRPAAGGAGGGGGGKRGTAEQDQMIKRPRRKTNSKAEK